MGVSGCRPTSHSTRRAISLPVIVKLSVAALSARPVNSVVMPLRFYCDTPHSVTVLIDLSGRLNIVPMKARTSLNKETAMLKKWCILLLTASLIYATNAAPMSAQSRADNDDRAANKVMKNILKLGTGPEARVRVKLRNKTELVGFVSSAGPDSFAVTDIMTGKTTTVEYTQVKKLMGSNSRTGVIVGGGPGKVGNIFLKVVPIGLGIGLAAFFVIDVFRRGGL